VVSEVTTVLLKNIECDKICERSYFTWNGNGFM